MSKCTNQFNKIQSLEIDFDRDVLKINGESVIDKPVIVNLPGPDGWPLQKLFNAHLATGTPEECDVIGVEYRNAKNKLL